MRLHTLGPYLIDRELGVGGMGTVHLATVIAKGAALPVRSRVALKVIHPHLLERQGFFRRFLREAEIGKAVRHGNVVQTLDVDMLSVDGRLLSFLVMEYVEGQTLADLLDEMEQVPEGLCRHIGREIAKGLTAIHAAGAVHRDLKPENVLITADHVVKIMDLGVARLADEIIRLSRTGGFLGSVHYAAPEQFAEGGGDADARTDIRALGLILYELASGANPFFADDFGGILRKVLEGEPARLSAQNPQLSPFFEEIVHNLLQPDPEARLQTAAELFKVLEEGESSEWWKLRSSAMRVQTRRPLRRIRIPRETAVYGREEELARFEAEYRRAESGEGRVVLVRGEAGIGKTRFVDEVIGRLAQSSEDLVFLNGSYLPAGAATAAGAWTKAYLDHFGAEGLEEALAPYLAATPALIPAFAALLRAEPAPKGHEQLTPGSVPTPFVQATRALAEESPVVVLIEDLHFAPAEGRALFSALARAVPGHRILLVGTARPGLPEAWDADLDRMEHAGRIDLDRLGPKDLSMLLVEAFRSERLAEELGFRIATKSDGNPFFVFEIIRGLREGELIRRRPDGTWVTTKVIEEIGIPSSVQDMIQARVADLEFEERNLLEVAACCGFEFDGRLPAEVLGIKRIPGLQLLGQIEKRHRLIRSAGAGFVFDHHQLCDSLYAGISPALKEEYHAEIAVALERRAGAAKTDPEGVDGATVAAIAEHYVAGGRREPALRYLDAALDHLENGYENDQAIALVGRALSGLGSLEDPVRARLLLRRAERLGLLGRREEEGADLRDAVRLADSGEDGRLRSRAHLALGIHHWSVSRHEEARPEIQRALDLAREAGERQEEAQATGSLGNVGFSLGRYEEARELYLSYLEIAREVGDVAGEGRALANLGTVHWSLGRYEEARAHYEERLALAKRTGDLRGEARVTGSLGNVFFSLGRHEEAREHYEQNLALSREIGDRRWEGVATGNLALVFLTLGRNEEALEGYRRWVTIAREVGDRRGEASATGNLGSVYENLGRFEEARLQHERGLALAREIGDRRGEGLALVDLGPLHADLGDPDRARDVLTEALAIFTEIGARREEAYALHRLGRVAERTGDAKEAARLLGEALTLRRELEYSRGVAESLVAIGGLLQADGRMDEARAHLEEALALGEDLDGPDTVTLTSCRLALLPGGDPSAALQAFADHEGRLTLTGRMEARTLLYRATGDAAHLADAHRLLETLTEHAPLACRESMIARVPLHREIREAWEARGDAAP